MDDLADARERFGLLEQQLSVYDSLRDQLPVSRASTANSVAADYAATLAAAEEAESGGFGQAATKPEALLDSASSLVSPTLQLVEAATEEVGAHQQVRSGANSSGTSRSRYRPSGSSRSPLRPSTAAANSVARTHEDGKPTGVVEQVATQPGTITQQTSPVIPAEADVMPAVEHGESLLGYGEALVEPQTVPQRQAVPTAGESAAQGTSWLGQRRREDISGRAAEEVEQDVDEEFVYTEVTVDWSTSESSSDGEPTVEADDLAALLRQLGRSGVTLTPISGTLPVPSTHPASSPSPSPSPGPSSSPSPSPSPSPHYGKAGTKGVPPYSDLQAPPPAPPRPAPPAAPRPAAPRPAPERGGASAELRAAILAERWRALWQYDLELIELSNPKLGKSSKKEL
jgi:hypothetical protein